MKVLIAPDSFKGTISADAAASAIAQGWRSIRREDELRLIPQADGGEGTLDAIERSVPDAVRRTVSAVTGPDGSPVAASWLELPDGTGVVELAESSGLTRMPRLDARGATSRGLGEVICAALDHGCDRLVIAVGGSASTDAGLPVLEALGWRRPPERGAVVLTDVTAPLLGPNGAAAVYGPQKGASPEDIAFLEHRLAAAVEQLGADPNRPGAGAAGGVGYGLLAWGARIESGARHIAELTGLVSGARSAEVLLTGEGRFDGQSLTGKVVGEALGLGVPAGVIAGAVTVEPPCWSRSLELLAGSLDAAMSDPGRWLAIAGSEAARHWSPSSGGMSQTP